MRPPRAAIIRFTSCLTRSTSPPTTPIMEGDLSIQIPARPFHPGLVRIALCWRKGAESPGDRAGNAMHLWLTEGGMKDDF